MNNYAGESARDGAIYSPPNRKPLPVPNDVDAPKQANCWDRASELRNILSELLDATFPMAFYPSESDVLKQQPRPDDPGLVEFMWGLVLDMRVLQKRIEHLRAITGGRL